MPCESLTSFFCTDLNLFFQQYSLALLEFWTINVLKILQYYGCFGHGNVMDMSLNRPTVTEISGQDVLIQLFFSYGISSRTDNIIKCIKYIIWYYTFQWIWRWWDFILWWNWVLLGYAANILEVVITLGYDSCVFSCSLFRRILHRSTYSDFFFFPEYP